MASMPSSTGAIFHTTSDTETIAYIITIDAKNPQYKKPPRFLRGGLFYAKDCMMFWAISFLDVQQSMACFSM